MAGLGPNNLFRDVFNRATISGLARRIHAVYPGFDYDLFLRDALAGIAAMGFLERSRRITDRLRCHLPQRYEEALPILLAALGPELEHPGKTVWEAFVVMPQTAFVARYGTEHFDLSMHALYEMTKRFSAEGDLRTFIELDFDRAWKYLQCWTGDRSPHVRRLVSEGTRPRLPLAPRIRRFQDDPRPVIALLDVLKDDPELYVRRSVANNINDIAKDHPGIAIETLAGWYDSGDANVKWVVRHAARTLVKRGHPAVFTLLGYQRETKIAVDRLSIAPQPVRIGEAAWIRFDLVSTTDAPQSLIVDYVLRYVKSSGMLREKVFKLRTVRLGPWARVSLEKRHRFADTSGRTHYPGTHVLELQINGVRHSRVEFDVVR